MKQLFLILLVFYFVSCGPDTEDLQSEIIGLKKEVNDLEYDKEQLQKKVEELESQIEDLESRKTQEVQSVEDYNPFQ